MLLKIFKTVFDYKRSRKINRMREVKNNRKKDKQNNNK